MERNLELAQFTPLLSILILSSGLQLTVFSDADMARDIDGRWSTSGVLVFLGSAPISWLALKQKVVALSMCEAEYVVAATAACQAV